MKHSVCVKCGTLLVKRGSTYYCDQCKRVALPCSTSLDELKQRYKAEKDIIGDFCDKNSGKLHAIEQRYMDRGKLTDLETQLRDALSQYNCMKGEMKLLFEENNNYSAHEKFYYTFFHLTERVIELVDRFEDSGLIPCNKSD